MNLSLTALALLAGLVSAPASAGNNHVHLSADKAVQGGQVLEQGEVIKLAQAAAEMADGEIKRISKGSKKLTIKHGVIKNLEMPPMTMAFSVSDEKMLDMVKKGDKIKFKAESIDGKMVVTEIAPQ